MRKILKIISKEFQSEKVDRKYPNLNKNFSEKMGETDTETLPKTLL